MLRNIFIEKLLPELPFVFLAGWLLLRNLFGCLMVCTGEIYNHGEMCGVEGTHYQIGIAQHLFFTEYIKNDLLADQVSVILVC